ncbi:Crp/Fnr family transcriptional regulator [Mitsuokella sp. AF21-1AC]|uniref:Crp/Fnr family transcriptional regulator n=1 Tax=Mitsuokella sp. AF21-1AC TaxID=2292235 RepID=UPI000E478C59|nr:Crp/Fnr family transcriptional regulator [Mitsuokella sp. AF21-1AC]RGS70044.1 Crp/Fnr family transcriptional regulator [Mitsuokella sp. AF21-1AC]
MYMESLVRQLYELPGKVVTLHDGEYLFHEGDPAKYFYIVRSGHIFITKYASSGRVLSLRLASRSSIIGELPLFQAEPSYIFNAVAQCPSEVYAIEFPVLQSYLEKRPQLAVNLLKIISNHMRKQHSKFRDLLLYGKKGALYSTLIRLANSYGRDEDGGVLIPVPLTNQELANYSATARESLNRMLGELKKAGVIEYRGHLLFIKNLDYLKKEIQCENCGREVCNIE